MQKKTLKKLFLLSFVSALLSGCVTVWNTRPVTVAGEMRSGAIWSETLSANTGDLSLDELIDFIEPQEERTCCPVPGFNICADDQEDCTPVILPARAGAIMQSAEDYNKNKTTIEVACRLLRTNCTYEKPK